MSKKKTNLGVLLSAIDNNKIGFYGTLQEDFNDWVSMRWASCSVDNMMYSLIYCNELVNKNFTECKDHQELQWMAISLVGSGNRTQYKWIAPPKKKKKGNKKDKYIDKIMIIHPEWKQVEVDTFIKLNAEEDIKNYIEQHGENDV